MTGGMAVNHTPGPPRGRTRRWALLSLLAIGAGSLAVWGISESLLPRLAGWLGGAHVSETALERLGQYGQVPDFALIERSGRTVTRADLVGKVWVANFIYTQCTETCPTQSAELARLDAEFATAPDFRLVSITVDPAYDTPDVLAGYAKRYGAAPERWLFLIGPKQIIYRLAMEGFKLSVHNPDSPNPTGSVLPLLGPRPAFATHGSQGLVIHSGH
jgi:cytochrome oxidase Cu insertion factor (SCO1/SenC/PrrC family)